MANSLTQAELSGRLAGLNFLSRLKYFAIQSLQNSQFYVARQPRLPAIKMYLDKENMLNYHRTNK